MATTALQKLRDKSKKVQIVISRGNIAWAPEGTSIVISTPDEINSIMAKVPKGRIITTNEIRDYLTDKHKAQVACPLTTGIFINIAAKASEELKNMGAKETIAWWRTLKSDGSLNPKSPGGVEAHKRLLEAEGFKLEPKGKKNWRVVDIDKKLFKLKD